MALVSITIPTFNRADTLLRAVNSVLAQSFQDWELLIVDDGSTDKTEEVVRDIDPRVKFIRSKHQGCAGARNLGLKHSTGKYLAFLDSDDEWLPHHLELSVAFLEAHPNAEIVSAEIWENVGKNKFVKHYQIELSDWYLRGARRLRSRDLDLPPGDLDCYMRIFKKRERLGAWAGSIMANTPYLGGQCYSGNVFEHFRWGWLICMQPTVITRRAFEAVGYLDTTYSSEEDFGFLAKLCRNFELHFISVPACIKHELGEKGAKMAQGHLAGRNNAVRRAECLLRWFDELFWNRRREDKELCALRSLKLCYLGQVLLERGDNDQALIYFRQATEGGYFNWHALVLKWMVQCVPGARSPERIYSFLHRAIDSLNNVRAGQTSLIVILGKMLGTFGDA